MENNFIDKLKIDRNQSSEKYQHKAEEILEFLIRILQEINLLEQEILERSKSLKNPHEPHQLQPGEKELWVEYAKRRKEITSPISLKESMQGGRSFGKPTKYEYLSYPDTQIIFIMKSENRAVVEIIYKYGTQAKDQFVLKKDGVCWKIDTKKYGFVGENTWYKDEL